MPRPTPSWQLNTLLKSKSLLPDSRIRYIPPVKAIQILDLIEILEESLLKHTQKSQNEGSRYFNAERVQMMPPDDQSTGFDFIVEGADEYVVGIEISENEGVTLTCSCPASDIRCKHTAACLLSLQELLEEMIPTQETILVNRTPSSKPVVSAPKHSELTKRLEEAHARKLNRNERSFVSLIRELFDRAVIDGRPVMGNHVSAIFGGYHWPHWERITLWHEAPKDDFELWLYLVHLLQSRRIEVLDFLKPVSDLEPIRDKLQAWERSKAVSEWTTIFEESRRPIGVQPRDSNDSSPQELQLHFTANEAILNWRESDENTFVPIPKNILKSLNDPDLKGSFINLTSSSELLFHRLRNRGQDRVKQKLKYDDYFADEILSGLFEHPSLGNLLIAPTSLPFQRLDEKLQWKLADKKERATKDYQLTLESENGTPLPRPFQIIDGTPSYALTNDSIIRIPNISGEHFQQLTNSPTLPAEAVESAEGIRFLEGLKIDLPKRLSKRIEKVPLKLQITCELEKEYREECLIEVESVLPNGKATGHWTGQDWISTRKAKLPNSKARNKVIVFDDTEILKARRLFSKFSTNYDSYRGQHKINVTRKFPEIFSLWLSEIPKGAEIILKGELAAFENQAIVGKMRLEVEESEQDWFDLKVVLEISDTTLSADEIKLLLAANGKWVRLEGKGWRRLEHDHSEEDDLEFAKLGLNPNELTDEPQRLHALQLASNSARKLLPDEQAASIQRRVEEIQTRVTPPKPRGIKADMRPYQKEGYHFLAYLTANGFGGILADDMGLGKTLQTLAWLLWLRSRTEKKSAPSLVICPKSVMDNWGSEVEKFAPSLSVRVWAAGTVKELPKNPAATDLHVINYSHLRSIGKELQRIPFLAVILDEGQYIKNPSSQTAKTARELKSEHRLVLTGTPIENRALDLWSLMSFAMPGVLGNRSQFTKLYDSKKDPLARIRLSSRVRPFLIRRTKSQVATDLPERIEDEIHCEIEGTQRKLYDAELKRAQQILLKANTQKQLSKLRFNFLTSLLRLRQICAHPALYQKTSRASSAKVEALLELLAPIMEEGAKVLIFSQFVELISILEKELKKNDIRSWTLTGSTENRGKLVDDFQSSSGPGVFLISLKAGGSGLNLTAASYVVLFDPWWNPAVEAQAIDRTHRIGQTSKIIAYRLVVKNSIEEKIRSLQAKKQALVADVLGEEKFSSSLSIEDFHYLFED